jgi:hypothetical protein
MCERILRIEKAAQLADRVLPLTQRPTTMRAEVIVDCAGPRVPDVSGHLASRDRISSLMRTDVHGGSA